ncbi:hypothetical protein [Natrinema longum]|uniref:hypothetical protein n=1 Tax=Natrinema longum TaxID=370324 RepID=UPI003CCE186C
MDRNDRAVTAFAMLGHAVFHTYELVIPIFVVSWLEAFSTTAAFLGVVAACAVIAALLGGTLRSRSGRRAGDGVTADD